MPLVNVPTTLLGQIDAGIGGKNGINFGDGKNQIGSFYFPEKVLIDPMFLATLSIKQMREGLVESLKAGVIGDRVLFQTIKDNPRDLLFKDLFLLEEVIKKAIELKVKVVSLDPWEKNQRKILNLGHTFAHALESLYKYKKFTHGEAVGLGMLCAVKMGIMLKITSPGILAGIKNILRQWKAPINVKALDAARALSLMSYDKKRKGKSLSFILPLKIGSVEIKDDIDDKIVLESLKEFTDYEKDIDR
jgi:3-dehydroquinate synthase